MNKVFFFVAALLLCNACASRPEGFVVRGNFPGMEDGMSVLIRNMENENFDTLAVGTVRQGKFELHGKVRTPLFCELQLHNRDIASQPAEIKTVNTYLFLENAELTLKAPHLDSMTFILPFFSGSADLKIQTEGTPLQREFYAYRDAVSSIQKTLQKSSDSLAMLSLEEYRIAPEEYRRLFKELYLQKQTASEALDAAKMEFIRRHPKSSLSLYLAESLLKTTFERTPEEIEELTGIASRMEDTVRRPYVLKIAETTKKLCKGSAYKELELTDTKGQTVKLSQYVHPDRYTLVDFWASWCGPCRWAIPKIKQCYDRYDRNRLAVVSISLDQKKADWEKAVKQEKMPWTQLWAGNEKQMQATCWSYNITGIPRLMLIAPDGTILFNGHDADALRITMEQVWEKE